MCVVVVTASMVNKWQQRNNGRIVLSGLRSYSDDLSTAPNLSRGLASPQEQSTSPATIAHGVSSSRVFPRSSYETSASTKQIVTDQIGHPSIIKGQGSSLEDAQFQAPPLAKHFHRTSGSISFPASLNKSTTVDDLGGDNEKDGDIDDEDEVESGESDEDDDDDDEDDNDNDAITGKKKVSGSSNRKQGSSSSKARRFRLTHNQTRFLMGEFARQTHPDGAQRRRLSKEIPGLSPRQVQVWFQNRRAKLKRLPVQDREKMMKSRALPEDFDISNTLRSPFGIDASRDFSARRQSLLFSPNRSSTVQSRENTYDRGSIDASHWRDAPREGYTESPLSLAAEFSPYLAQFGQRNSPISSNILAASPKIDSFSYARHRRGHPQLGEPATQSAGFSSTVPGSSMQLHPGQEQFHQAQSVLGTSGLLRFPKSPGLSLDPNVQNQEDTTPGGTMANTFEMQSEQNATFADLSPEALAFWNAQPPIYASPGHLYNFHQDLALQASPAALLQASPGRTPLQISTTRPQSSDSNIIFSQQANPNYTRTIYDTRQARLRQMQSPATAYQTPISATLQGLPPQNTEDGFLLQYHLDTGKGSTSYNPSEIQSPGMVESYRQLRGQFNVASNISEQVSGMPIPGTVYESPYQPSQPRISNIVQAVDSPYNNPSRTAGFGDMPPTPQSAGLKRRHFEGNEANPSQVSTSQKRRKKSAASSAYESQDPGPQSSI